MQFHLKAQSKQAVQRKVIESTTACLQANQSSNLKSMVASDVETNMTVSLHHHHLLPLSPGTLTLREDA